MSYMYSLSPIVHATPDLAVKYRKTHSGDILPGCLEFVNPLHLGTGQGTYVLQEVPSKISTVVKVIFLCHFDCYVLGAIC